MNCKVVAKLCRFFLHLAGWRLQYQEPAVPKAVVIVYPHTSNWDFVLGILAKGATGLPASWVGKDILFKGLFGVNNWLFRRLGGVPVNRRQSTGFVAQMVKEFDNRESFYLALAPEGTRSLTAGWKSGFYHLAVQAHVPLLLLWIDFANKEIGLSDCIYMTGDPALDLERISKVYEKKQGRFPQLQSPVKLM